MGSKGARPRRRTEDLVVRAQGEETLVLDRRSDTAHNLPAEMSLVWGACTGTNTLAEIASAAGIDEATAAGAVDQLMERDLLEVPVGTDRRQFLQRTALVGAGAVTIAGITSVVGPMASAAASQFSVEVIGLTCTPNGRFNEFDLQLVGFRPGTYTVTPVLTNPGFGSAMSPPSMMVTVPNGLSGDFLLSAVPANGALPAMPTLMVTVTQGTFEVTLTVTYTNPCSTTGASASATTAPSPGTGTSTDPTVPSPAATSSGPAPTTSPSATP